MPLLVTDARTRVALQLGLAITVAEELVVSKESAVETLVAQLDAAHGHIFEAHKAGLIPDAEVERMRSADPALNKYFEQKAV